MPLSLKLGRKTRPAVLLLMVLLAGCGGSSGTSTSTVNPLTNPDVVLFASGRATDATWSFYAMNPDGSGVTAVPALGNLGSSAASVRGIAVNQTGTLVTLTIDNVDLPVTRSLIRLSDGAGLYGTNLTVPLGNFAANSNGTQLAVAGQPLSTDPFAIYLLKPDGTQKTQVAAIPTGTYVSEITFAPDDQTLYFVEAAPLALFHVGNGVLYKLASGGVPVAVANINAPIYSVHTSRDGTKLAFLTYSEATDLSSLTFTPYTLNADGTGLTKGVSTTTTNDKVDPAVRGEAAPVNSSIASRADGFHVLYSDTKSGAAELYDMRPDGSGLKQITSTAAGNAIPGSRAATVGSVLTLGGR